MSTPVSIQQSFVIENENYNEAHRSEQLNLQLMRTTTAPKENSIVETVLVGLSILLLVLLFPLSLLVVFVKVRQFERVVILRNGKLRHRETYGPGLIFYLPCIDSLKFLDLRVICHSVHPQETLTKDSLSMTVDAVVYYKIKDPILAVMRVTDYKHSTQYIAATTLRNAIGSKKLSEILKDRRAVSLQVFESMRNMTHNWGVQVLRVEIKDIRLPLQLQKAMAAEAESTRLASAKIKVAKAEIECNRSLQTATEMLMDNQWGMTLRYLQSLQTISGDKTHTIVIPYSVETLKNIFK
ncbi:unnamed protein product [Arctia plantaginis]|uniref:Band 7 domain-containing protein n=1 Tax=Arctia plantaginis TaxID=874455 RepID=A0A8S1ADS0_ARCPL|nr:unnamed protein product [Arctia plantaginis]CAB3243213.1 unnamed protein product [Arctia plantaginis]